jgi:hypothetical protein
LDAARLPIRRRAGSVLFALLFALPLAGCGGGGDSGSGAGAGAGGNPGGSATPTVYADSVAIGSWGAQSMSYQAAQSPAPASVTTTLASGLLKIGSNVLAAEHVDAAFPGMRVACVSGRGESTNVIGPINLGVTAQSAAVLLDAGWAASPDSAGAWAALATRGTELSGWENCGVKPEGPPSRSSRLLPQADGGYVEDVYDGNPGTTFNTLTQAIPPAQMAAMLSNAGFASGADPQRPLRLYWRVFVDGTGRQLLIQMGVPTSAAPASAAGFIALYTAS